jgi:hypothetical protein
VPSDARKPFASTSSCPTQTTVANPMPRPSASVLQRLFLVSSTLDYLFARLWPCRAPWLIGKLSRSEFICSLLLSSLTFEDQEMLQVVFHER